MFICLHLNGIFVVIKTDRVRLIRIPDPLSLVCPSCFQGRTGYGSLHPSATQMFQMPWLVTMSIAATRMYRSLSDFLSPDVYDIPFLSSLCLLYFSVHSNPHSNGRNIPVAKAVPAVPTSFTSMQVTVHTTREQYPTSQPNDYGTYTRMDGKMHGPAIDPRNDIERGPDK